MLPKLNSCTCVVFVWCSYPTFLHIYTWNPFHNVYNRDSPLRNISASTTQAIHQMLPHGYVNKAHFLNKHDEFLNKWGLSCTAVLQCALVSTFRVLILHIAGILPFLTSQHSPSSPATRCYHIGMLPRLISWTSVANSWTSVVDLRFPPISSLAYSLNVKLPPPNVLPSTNQPICQKWSHGYATVAEFLNNCVVSMVISSVVSSHLCTQ